LKYNHLIANAAAIQNVIDLTRAVLSPAFVEARRRREVVEHRIARLVHLGIRQARYFGRTKTLFQVCLCCSAISNSAGFAVAAASTCCSLQRLQSGGSRRSRTHMSTAS
jgi:hypothetical protein